MVKLQQAAMSPQDVVVLLKIVCYGQESWLQVQLAEALELSQSEISNSLARSRYAGLLDESGRQVRRQALLEFLQYGISIHISGKTRPNCERRCYSSLRCTT